MASPNRARCGNGRPGTRRDLPPCGLGGVLVRSDMHGLEHRLLGERARLFVAWVGLRRNLAGLDVRLVERVDADDRPAAVASPQRKNSCRVVDYRALRPDRLPGVFRARRLQHPPPRRALSDASDERPIAAIDQRRPSGSLVDRKSSLCQKSPASSCSSHFGHAGRRDDGDLVAAAAAIASTAPGATPGLSAAGTVAQAWTISASSRTATRRGPRSPRAPRRTRRARNSVRRWSVAEEMWRNCRSATRCMSDPLIDRNEAAAGPASPTSDLPGQYLAKMFGSSACCRLADTMRIVRDS